MVNILKIILILLGLSLFLLLIFYQKDFKNFFYSFSSPLERSLWQKGIAVSDFFNSLFKFQEIKKENKELILENQKLLYYFVSHSECQKENEILRKGLEIKEELGYQLIFADVISKDIFNDYILINKGEKNGIFEDLPVITAEKVLVGRIDEVYNDFSRIKLISHSEISIPAEILNKEGRILVGGKGNGKVSADLIDLNIEISSGDVIYSAWTKDVLPRGILIGTIKEARKEDIKFYQSAEIIPFFDISRTNRVFIIKNF